MALIWKLDKKDKSKKKGRFLKIVNAYLKKNKKEKKKR